MCGIIGYVGRQEAAPILLEGLERMEYRGYDSTGMAVCGDGVLRVCKKKGRVQVLREMSHDGADLPGTLGIGHTRWATHGEPSDVNAHPHLSQSGKFAVVPQRHHREFHRSEGGAAAKGLHLPLRDGHRGGGPAAGLLLQRLRRLL